MCFTGNPGTAKTTFARLLGNILKEEGVLSSGKFVECGRADLVGKYVGWTARTVIEKFEKAKGGILFIDEAYSLVEDRNSFATEAINTIVQEMENHRDDVLVIFAGYPEKMNQLLNMNEGLRSRIPHYLNFPDYTAEELYDILLLMLDKQGYKLKDENRRLVRSFEHIRLEPNFGNGRYVRNLLENAIFRHAERVMASDEPTEDDLTVLSVEDFYLEVKDKSFNKTAKIGFCLQ